MDREGLRELLDRECVDPGVYDLDGQPVEDGLTLDGARVLYTERGRSSVYRAFATENEACAFLAEELLRNEWDLFKIVASSPYGGVSEPEFLAHWLASVGLACGAVGQEDFRVSYTPGQSGGTVIRLGVRRKFLRAHGLDY